MTEKKMSASERLLAKTKRTSDVAANYTTPVGSNVSKAPVTMPGQLGAFRLEAQKYADRIKELESQVQQQEIALDELHEVPKRRRKLSEAEYVDLRENLRRNPLVTPITVRIDDAGRFEIVSGHNRVSAYRELGKTSISSIVQRTDGVQANINAFYANLLQTDLSDFEKFVGFKMMQDELHLSLAKIAEHSGKSQSFVSRLMAFADLPREAQAIIEANPAIIGMDAAYQLATIARDGNRKDAAEKVIIAVKKLADGELDQRQAVKLASDTNVAKASVLSKPIKIKSGKTDYCALRRVDKSLRIDFRSANEAEALQQAVLELLEKRAEQVKADKA